MTRDRLTGRCFRRAVALSVVLAGGILTAVPASAATSGVATVLNPTAGALVEEGDLPVSIDFHGDGGAGNTQIAVYCEGDSTPMWSTATDDHDGYSEDVYLSIVDWQLDEMSGPLRCEVKVTGAYVGQSSFRLEPYLVGETFGDITADHDTIYPVVRDGLRDRVRLDWGGNCVVWGGYFDPNSPCAAYTIADASGKVVRRGYSAREVCYDLDGNPYTDDMCVPHPTELTWDGRNGAGRTVSPGEYTITLRGRDGATASKTVEVATTTVPTTVVEKVVRPSSKKAKGNCYAKKIGDETVLDCWAGTFAEARWKVKLPAGARVLARKIVGQKQCCERGTLIVDSKVSGRNVNAMVRVTGWRAFTVKYLMVRYRYPKRY